MGVDASYVDIYISTYYKTSYDKVLAPVCICLLVYILFEGDIWHVHIYVKVRFWLSDYELNEEVKYSKDCCGLLAEWSQSLWVVVGKINVGQDSDLRCLCWLNRIWGNCQSVDVIPP